MSTIEDAFRGPLVPSVLACIAALALGCGGAVEMTDASADAAVDAVEDCIPNDGFEPTTGPGYCCSHHSIQNICVQACYPRGNKCKLPEATCCSDADTCIEGQCR